MTLTIRSISLSIFNSNKPTNNKNNLLFRQMRYKNEAKASPKNMKKFPTALLAVSLLSLGLGGCNELSDSSESSSQKEDYTYKWSEEAKSLMKKYCGSVLPYPEGFFVNDSDSIVVEELSDAYDNSFLQIVDTGAPLFTLQDYYLDLVDAGWKAIETYNGNIIQTNSNGSRFAELTNHSDDFSVGYDLLYFYVPSGDSGANVIRCYNDMSASSNAAASWNEDEQEAINLVTTVDLPFVKLGELNAIQAADSNQLQMIDIYTEDLSKEYSDALLADGFALNEKESRQYDAYILSKNLDDGANLSAMLYYFNGNNFTFLYTPAVKTYDNWPSEVIEDIKAKTGVEVPAFEIAGDGHYYVYQKRDVICIQGDIKDDSVNENYTEKLENIGLKMNSDWAYTNWEETINVTPSNLVDENSSLVGFGIAVEITTPASSFSQTWPTETIREAVSSLLKVDDVLCPALDGASLPNTGKELKYRLRDDAYIDERIKYYYEDIADFPGYYNLVNPTDEEILALASELANKERGIYIEIADVAFAAYEAYEKALVAAAWHKGEDDMGRTVYEDAAGKLAITLDGYEGLTKILITVGSGQEHKPSLYFAYSYYELPIGKTTNIAAIANMLPYKITYSSSDATGKISVDNNGNVTIAEDALEGTTATITASMEVPGEEEPRTAECTVKAKTVIDTDAKTGIEKIVSILESDGYDVTPDYASKPFPFLNAYFPTSFGADALKEYVESNLILEGFEKSGNWTNGTYGDDDIPCQFLDFKLSDQTMLSYFVYTQGDSLVLYIAGYDIVED